MSSGILGPFRSPDLPDKDTYGDAMRVLRRLKKTRVGEGEWQIRRMAKVDADVVRGLNIFEVPMVQGTQKGGKTQGSMNRVPRRKRGTGGYQRTSVL